MITFTIAIAAEPSVAADVACDGGFGRQYGEVDAIFFSGCTPIDEQTPIISVSGGFPVYRFRDRDGVFHVHAGGCIHVTEEGTPVMDTAQAVAAADA